ncbi:hypothetical protein PM082_014751 [Marasmius tenuissimus]|nr:hypothetical protein PM082_014751 [Marasmius tenuissimus]
MAGVQTVGLDGYPWFWKQRDPIISNVLDEVPSSSSLSSPDTDSKNIVWRKAHSFPSEVHVELMKANLIPDPYLGFYEHDVQWIGEVEWLYSTSFPTPSSFTHAELVFHGLDTLVDVYLNGKVILSSKNQFQVHTVPVAEDNFNPKGENTLFFHFKSAKLLAKELEEKFGRVRGGSTNLGDPSRVYVRKAQYDWRWDWGPELMTAGPYRPIELKTYTIQVSDIYARTSLDANSFKRSLSLDITVKGSISVVKKARVSLAKWASETVVRSEEVPIPSLSSGDEIKNVLQWELTADEVSLWWPVGYGEQPLYDLKVEILGEDGSSLSALSRRIGFRTVELRQNSLAAADQYGEGSTFFFVVNRVPIFAVGSNWIPADNFLTTVMKERYRDWMKLAVEGGQNMIRVWGGGVYEDDAMMDACDEFGLLCWHDFQFACGVYPGAQFPEFVESVKREAEDNVKRLRHHPCMALWCGNNEDYQMVLQWGDVPTLPATLLYEDVLPSVVDALTEPPIPYHRGSPYGGKGWDTADPTMGDVHQWNIWGGKELPWQNYDVLGGRFVSEFGMPALPSMKTIEYYFQSEEFPERNWHPQSKLVAQHTRAGAFERRFAIAMNDNFKVTEDLETYCYLTQLMQAAAIGYAYSVWRREWRGPGKEYCAGVLVWQLNDCWPVTSWAIADYFLRAKPVYYAIKRASAPLALGIYRTVHKNRPNDRPKQFYEYGAFQTVSATLDVWASSSSLVPLKDVALELTFFDIDDPSWKHTETRSVPEIKPNQGTELVQALECPGKGAGGAVVVLVRLLNQGKEVSRETDWPQPYRYLVLPDPELTVEVIKKERTRLEIQAEVKRPAKGVFFELDEDGAGSGAVVGTYKEMKWSKVKWSDNGVDLVPGEKRVIVVTSEGELDLATRKLTARWLGREKAVVVVSP